jgi:UDP-N-acetylmuramoylalanine--D-glutamate ligase
MDTLRDAHVLVLGLGDSGLAMARWCAGRGALVRVWDSREEPPQAASLARDVPGAVLFSGPLDGSSLDNAQRVFKSPGLAPTDPRIAGLLDAAARAGVPVQGELDLFAQALAALKAAHGYAPKVLAITGTNGKTTTTAMTALLVERCGLRVAMAGNIGPTMLDTLAAALALEVFPAPEVEGEAEPVAAKPAAVTEAPTPLAEEHGVVEYAVSIGAAPLNAEEAPAPDTVVGELDGLPESPAMSGDAADVVGTTDTAADAPVPAATAVTDDAADFPSSEGSGPPAHLVPPPPPGPTFEHLPEVWVLELSSFQLDGVRGFEPTAATVLNLSQDHLDWHGSMAAYAEAKSRIFGAQAVMVINRDDATVSAMVPAPVMVKSGVKGRPGRTVERRVVRFGLDAPKQPGDFGLVVTNGLAWLVRASELDETIKRKKGAEPEDLHVLRLMPADALRVRGRHNAANALAALALATAAGCPLAPMLHGLREYAGEPHRVEHVATIDEVDVFDDSKGTNVGATVAALLGLGADRAPSRLVVILGGDGKGQDFSPLVEPVRRHARAVATIGRDAAAIEDVLASTGVRTVRHDTLEAATRWAFDQAQRGDAVLLSPACASLDMFRNYGHRAQVFVAAVEALAVEVAEGGADTTPFPKDAS